MAELIGFRCRSRIDMAFRTPENFEAWVQEESASRAAREQARTAAASLLIRQQAVLSIAVHAASMAERSVRSFVEVLPLPPVEQHFRDFTVFCSDGLSALERIKAAIAQAASTVRLRPLLASRRTMSLRMRLALPCGLRFKTQTACGRQHQGNRRNEVTFGTSLLRAAKLTSSHDYLRIH